MRRHLAMVIAATAIAPAASATDAASWIFQPSAYSHDPISGHRVNQYMPEKVSYTRSDSTYRQSGYRHHRVGIRGADGSVDRLHVVESWGAGEAIRPYGEWQRPFRAGATPYGPWGNPQGPWTLPFDSWVNPYGSWNRYPYYYPWSGPYGVGDGRHGGRQDGPHRKPGHRPPHGSPKKPPHGGPNASPHGGPHAPPHGGPSGPPHGP